ncbi:hypothetical protein Scep_028058 [Stephania cephalantha]|uniref:Uncharacterized protein n=1 Tax=Stephania cephalantha TaxID=152367 RepID=A0AAP0E981_9MAGN
MRSGGSAAPAASQQPAARRSARTEVADRSARRHRPADDGCAAAQGGRDAACEAEDDGRRGAEVDAAAKTSSWSAAA